MKETRGGKEVCVDAYLEVKQTRLLRLRDVLLTGDLEQSYTHMTPVSSSAFSVHAGTRKRWASCGRPRHGDG